MWRLALAAPVPVQRGGVVLAVAPVRVGPTGEEVADTARLSVPGCPVQRGDVGAVVPARCGVDRHAGSQELVDDGEAFVACGGQQCTLPVGGAGVWAEEAVEVAGHGGFDDVVHDGAGRDEQVDDLGVAGAVGVGECGAAGDRDAGGLQIGSALDEGAGHVGFAVAGRRDQRVAAAPLRPALDSFPEPVGGTTRSLTT